jgi:hypothetical protein
MGYREYLLNEEAKDLNVPPALARKLAELVKFGLLEKGSKMVNRYIASTGMSVEEYEEAIHKMLDAAANAIERFATYESEEEVPEEEPMDDEPGEEEPVDALDVIDDVEDLEVILGDEESEEVEDY